MSDIKNDWAYWHAALAGKNPQYTDGEPQSGYYRDDQSPVAIWLGNEGTLIGVRGGVRIDPKRVWLHVCRRPIPFEIYQSVVKGNPWPDAHRTIGDNSSAMGVDQQFADQIQTKLEYFRGWLKKAGDAIGWTKETADAASDIKTAIAKIRTDGERKHDEEKAPVLVAGKAIDAKWKAVKDAATAAEKEIVKAAQPYLVERKRLQDIADQAAYDATQKAADERRAKEAPTQREEPQPQPASLSAAFSAPIKSGTSGKGIRLVEEKRVVIVDIIALAAHYATTHEGREAAIAWAMVAGKKLPEGSIPGIKIITEEVAK